MGWRAGRVAGVQSMGDGPGTLYQRSTETNTATPSCDQSEFLYASDRSLRFGLPLYDIYAGKRQELLDFNQQYDAAPELFLVPASYREVTMPGLSAE
jgi:hypothetical protein